MTSESAPNPMAMWQDWFQKGTEAWTKMFNAPGANAESTEQDLTAQENFQAAVHPQVDAFLRLFNFPSRNQVNRLFEEVADVQARLQALSEENRVILRELLNRAPAKAEGE